MKKNYILLTTVFIIAACGGVEVGSSQPEIASVPPSSPSSPNTSTPATPSEPVSQPDTPSFSELQTEFENHYEYSPSLGFRSH
jgi:hypothetical protein